MPPSRQAKKRLRQDAVRNLRNRSAKNEIRTLTKKLAGLVAEGNKEEAQTLSRTLVSKLDKAAKRHIYHKNAVARRKSQVERAVGSLS